MSNGWAVRGLADPYFAFYQTSAVGMGGADASPGGGGEFSLYVEAALLALPQKAASDDEIHPLFAYIAWGPPRVTLLGIGCTPSGRLVGLSPGGGVVQTAKGLLVPDGITRTLVLSHLVSGATSALAIGEQQALGFTASGGSGNPKPAVGDAGKFVLFNGATLASRCACRLSEAVFGDENGTITWKLDEGGGSKLAGGGHDDFAQDFTLEAAILNDLAANSPWGTPTNNDPRASFAWQIATEYARIPAPTTSYFGRVQV